MDIYFDQTELDTAIADIQSDIVYRNLPVEQSSEPHPEPAPSSSAAAPPSNSFELRRYCPIVLILIDFYLISEINFLELSCWRGNKCPRRSLWTVESVTRRRLSWRWIGSSASGGLCAYDSNPQAWWREHSSEFPLFARFYRGHCAFQATSTASERVFNVEGLVFTPFRSVHYRFYEMLFDFHDFFDIPERCWIQNLEITSSEQETNQSGFVSAVPEISPTSWLLSLICDKL